MHKFFVPEDKFYDGFAVIEGDDVKHIYKVLRLGIGEKISINNCNGNEFLGEIVEVNKREVKVNIMKELPLNNESTIGVFLFQGLPKSSKMDLIIQKTTELGIKAINPVSMKRVVANGTKDMKLERWNRIALEACKQSKRSLIPVVNKLCTFEEMISQLKNMDLVVVPYENKKGYGLKRLFNKIDKMNIKNIAIVIGPEGGFEDYEINILESIGAEIVTLGPRILRTETAGFTALSIIMYEIGDLGGNM
ncbi:ribosomal RNA small subunit methyltransferase E [Clostridium tepidiprofundi DSM 19306]|uniref:Ribosomal RNA small subunit methyltransferase E n=1 Tax=Clostridium tepidiprofundi DSM 19306 TaxID=1121338 RepID=A0A151B3M8_9CLOT|nr:16S rRNA (uracil(1498)-N(3))-methyltransferase [Clostridium tepidiprofundi]KYH34524.1 ribosomal RNA small subunit methyltransferase E [Clostridium tepidiprofundi DSM 19306]